MLPGFDGLDRWIPKPYRERLAMALDTGAITLQRLELPEATVTDPAAQDHRWAVGADQPAVPGRPRHPGPPRTPRHRPKPGPPARPRHRRPRHPLLRRVRTAVLPVHPSMSHRIPWH
jgi:hypothetical protein